MARDFTDDDRNKDVVTPDGDRIGTVSNVREGRPYVRTNDDADQGVMDKIRSMLGWEDDEDEHELRDEHIDSVDDNSVRLRGR